MSEFRGSGPRRLKLYWLRADPDDDSADARFRRKLAALAREVMLARGEDPALIDPVAAPPPNPKPPAAREPPAACESPAAREPPAALEPADTREPATAASVSAGVDPTRRPAAFFDIRPTASFLMDLGGRAVRTALARAGAPAGRGTMDTVLLAVARFPGGVSTRELARTLDLPDSTVSSTVGRLGRERLVRRHRDPADRRRRVMRVTVEGLGRAEQVAAAWRQADQRLLDGLTISERDELCRLLRRAASALTSPRRSHGPSPDGPGRVGLCETGRPR